MRSQTLHILVAAFKLASTSHLVQGGSRVSVMMLSWGVVGVSILLVVFTGIAFCWQVLRRREVTTALQGCQAQVKEMQARSYKQEDEMRELTAGLRAEKAHVEQLLRKVKFAHGVAEQLQDDL